MRKAIQFSSLFLATSLLVQAQSPAAKPEAKKPAHPAAASDTAPAAARLPVTRVSLYKNGVGFFEHSGPVTGDQSVTIDFTTAQLNDVLQSLTAIDLNGGRIAGADYNSTTPLEQQIKALPFSLGDKVTFSGLFTALRGARVQVSGPGVAFTGRIVDIEMHKTGSGKEADGMTEGRFLTLASDSGEVRVVEITPAVTVRLLDTATSTNLTQFLKLLDSNRSDGLRHLTLRDNGTGSRELHVSYISEVPIWKSTYRILFTEPKAGDTKSQTSVQTVTLQGWSVVDNTTGEDWNNVQLSLIAGAPQSFIQPLSVPYYSRRPEIPLPQEAQLTPQTHESGDASQAKMGTGSGVGGNYGGGIARSQAATGAGLGGTIENNLYTSLPLGMNGGTGQSNLNENYTEGMPVDNVAAQRLQLGNYQSLARASINPNATAAAFDDYFAYNLTEPITIRKNESALVPTLQTKVDAERVTLWSPSEPTPLRALWITNTSNLTLDRGSFSIVEDGNFGGEGLLDPIHPAEKRLLSYAVDEAVHVTTSRRTPSTRITRFVVANGWLRQVSVDSRSVEYKAHNAAAEPRTIVIEHPLTAGWTLDPTSAKPAETTSTANRYSVVAQPGGSAVVHIDESRIYDQNWHLVETNDSQFNIILRNAQPSPALLAALQPILDARRRVADMQTALDKAKALLDTLHSDEARQRENITALANADKSSRERFVHDLNATEDKIAVAQKNMIGAQTNLQTAKDDLAGKIQSLQIDETI